MEISVTDDEKFNWTFLEMLIPDLSMEYDAIIGSFRVVTQNVEVLRELLIKSPVNDKFSQDLLLII